MSDIPPKNPLFDKAPGRAPDKPRDSIANPEEAKQVEELKKDLENLRSKFEHRGRAPIAGVKLEFYWFDPSLVESFPQNHAHLIGMTRVDLGPRSSRDCHKLVKCPKAWVPVLKLGG
jgi:hypothetical protein